ncbi:MAG TPA: hypothetical protein VKV96_09740 [Roseiarcus sp.]|nr:hypothetical protein [Roseiarcus sp.]
MMFLLRSAFWLCLVFSWMPSERTEMARVLDDAKTSLADHAEAAAKAGCAGSAAACGAVLLTTDRLAATPAARAAPKAGKDAKPAAKDLRPSANSLTASDRAPRWRGRPVKSGA